MKLDINDDTSGPDPMMVERLVEAAGQGLLGAVIPGVTTQADLLSALFTLLKRALKEAEDTSDPEDRKVNAKEVGRVLAELLMEFGAVDLQ